MLSVRFFLLLFLIIYAIPGKAQLVFYVSENGNDKNTGSRSAPFRTIIKALEEGQKIENKNISIQLRGGVYYLNKTIVLEAANIKARSIEIRPFQQERVTISAGRRLSLKWELSGNGIYKAKLPDVISFERLYVNNRLAVLARYPNYDSTARVFHGTDSGATSPQRVKRWKDPVGGYVHGLHAYEWGGFHYRITGVDDNGKLTLEGGWQNNRPAPLHNEFRFIENIFEELDAPNEWWLDQKNRILYYYPEKNTDLKTAIIEVSNLKNSIELHGNADRPVKNVRLKNLNFVHNERSLWYTREPLLRSDWTIYRGAALLLEGTQDCSITGCNFSGIGGNAIMLSGFNKEDTISGCHIYNIGASAICLIGDAGAVRSPAFRYEAFVPYSEMDKTPGPLTRNYPQQCVVTDNLLHHLGEIEKQATGVELEIAADITVSYNSIYNTPRAGINIGDGCFGGHIIEYNDVFNTVLETGDHGAFNSWGRDRFWHPDRTYMDSLVAAHPNLIGLDAQRQTIIRNNRFRCDHGWDIDLDDGSGNYAIYNNICLNGGLKLREGFNRIVKNNILVNNTFHPHVWFNNSMDIFKHNIVMKKYAPIQITAWGNGVDSNLLPDTAALQYAQQNGTDKNSLAGDPLFIDAEKGNYTVADNSPALRTGFSNFPMDRFGVLSAALKKMARQPNFPVLITETTLADKSATITFLGGTLKSVEGIGDRSAYGLPDESGVIVVAAAVNSLLAKSGLRNKDVILHADNQKIPGVKALMEVVQAGIWKGKMDIVIIRDQQLLKMQLLLK